MTRTSYRILLTTVCGLAAWVGPVIFLEDRLRVGYLVGGILAALLTWALLAGTIAAEPNIAPWMQGVIGAGAGVLSWVTISLVAVFDILPLVMVRGLQPFDPVWIMGGFSPLAMVGIALWRATFSGRQVPLWHAMVSALFRFSVPLFAIQIGVQTVGLPKQYRWLFLFTGVMFVVLDGLGSRKDSARLSS